MRTLPGWRPVRAWTWLTNALSVLHAVFVQTLGSGRSTWNPYCASSACSCCCGVGCGRTTTLNVPLPALPAASVAEQVTAVVPTGKVEPDTWSQVTGTAPSVSSVAVAENDTAAPPADVASTVMPAGTVTTGGVVSAPHTGMRTSATTSQVERSRSLAQTAVPPPLVANATGSKLTSEIGRASCRERV